MTTGGESARTESLRAANATPATLDIGPAVDRSLATRLARAMAVALWPICALGWLGLLACNLGPILWFGLVVCVLGSLTMGLGLLRAYWAAAATGATHLTMLGFYGPLIRLVVPADFSWQSFAGVGIAHVLLGLLPTVWVLARRPRVPGPWQCRRCGYALVGLPEPRCPECGMPFDAAMLPAGSVTTSNPLNSQRAHRGGCWCGLRGGAAAGPTPPEGIAPAA